MLDLQGSELDVIMASPIILNTVKAIYTEVEFIEAYKGQHLYTDVKNFLESQGFKIIAKDFTNEEAETKKIDIGQKWYGNILFAK